MKYNKVVAGSDTAVKSAAYQPSSVKAKEEITEYYEDKPWLKLDLAATLYAASRTPEWCRTYRTSIVLDHDIDPELLQQALTDTAKRLPTFCMKLRDGFFWSYFERTYETPKLVYDDKYPYRPIQLEGTEQPCFRILYYKSRISVEAFHSLSDGGGIDVLLETLVAHYLELRGEEIEKGGSILDVNDRETADEAGDSHFTYYDPSIGALNPPKMRVYCNENHAIKNYVNIIHGLFTVEEIKTLAATKELTITEYLVALIIFTFYSCADEPINLPISISVPMDLRKRFTSESVRNFVYMTDVSFNPEGRTDCSFDEICESIKGKLKQRAQREHLLRCISANVSAKSSPVIKPIPYPIKKAFLNNTYKKVQHSYTTFFTNLGERTYPEAMSKHIVRLESTLGDTPYMHFGCAAASVNGLFNFTFCSSNHDKKKQLFFFRFLSEHGIHVRIESNCDYD